MLANVNTNPLSILEEMGIDIEALNAASNVSEGGRTLYASFNKYPEVRNLRTKPWRDSGDFTWSSLGDADSDMDEDVPGLGKSDKIRGLKGFIIKVEIPIALQEYIKEDNTFNKGCSQLGYFDNSLGQHVKAYPGGGYDLPGSAFVVSNPYHFDKEYHPTYTKADGTEGVAANGAYRREYNPGSKFSSQPNSELKTRGYFGIDSNQQVKRCSDCILSGQHTMAGSKGTVYCEAQSGKMLFYATDLIVKQGKTEKVLSTKEIFGEEGILILMNLPIKSAIDNLGWDSKEKTFKALGYKGLLSKLAFEAKSKNPIKPISSSPLLNKIELTLVPVDESAKPVTYRYNFSWIPVLEEAPEDYTGPDPISKLDWGRQLKAAKAAWDACKPAKDIEIIDLESLLGEVAATPRVTLESASSAVQLQVVENLLEDEEDNPFDID